MKAPKTLQGFYRDTQLHYVKHLHMKDNEFPFPQLYNHRKEDLRGGAGTHVLTDRRCRGELESAS